MSERPAMRPEFEAIIPSQMRALPIDHRGYPIPWFLGKPRPGAEIDFRLAHPERFRDAILSRRCWVCGGTLGKFLTFVIGPMCMVNRTTGEPPCHRDCAEFSVKACPFLSVPAKGYRSSNLPSDTRQPAGLPLFHNPGVSVLWVTRGFAVMRVGDGYLLRMSDPTEVTFWHRGRLATRAEVLAAIDIGLPKLREVAQEQGGASLDYLESQLRAALALIPPPEAAA